jgi:hypothetical protein
MKEMRNERNEKKKSCGSARLTGTFLCILSIFSNLSKKGSTYFFTIEMALEASLTTT